MNSNPYFAKARLLLAALVLVALSAVSSHAEVVVFDDFEDGDINNDGTALESGVDVYGDYEPFYNATDDIHNDSPRIYPSGPTITSPTSPSTTANAGIHWVSTGGITGGANPAPSASARIIDDATGVQPETSGGFINSINSQTEVIPALNTGKALGYESKGRTRSISGFFERDKSWAGGDGSGAFPSVAGNGKQDTISLGPKVGDQVKVSFDFRVWMSAPNYNGNNPENHVPTFGEIRFGLYQDADDQLGQTNGFANPGVFSAWGVDGGEFRGTKSGPDASGDPGYFARLPIYHTDATSHPLFGPFADGRNARIVEETNPGNLDAHMQGTSVANGGDTETVAIPDQIASTFMTMDMLKRYSIEFSLTRFDETGMSTDPMDDGDNIQTSVTITNKDNTSETATLTGFDALDPTMVDDRAGSQSDFWDYFSIQLGGATDGDDLDFVMDNFMIEIFGSNESVATDDGDFNDDGLVDGADFLAWQAGFGGTGTTLANGNANGDSAVDGADLAIWQDQYGSAGGASSASLSAVPEPSSALLIGLGSSLLLGVRRRQR